MFGLSSVAYWVIGVLSVLLLVNFGALYYVDGKRGELLQQVGQLTVAVQTEKVATESAMRAVDAWKQSAELFQKTLTDMTKNQVEATKETRRLNDLFSEHDLGALAKAKPGLVGNRVNSGSAAMLRMLETASGARGTTGGGAAGEAAGAAETGAAPPH